jgi:hypothetical protein
MSSQTKNTVFSLDELHHGADLSGMSEPNWDDVQRRMGRIAGALRVLREEGHRWDTDLGDGIDLVADEAESVGMVITELIGSRAKTRDSGE